MLSTKFCCTPTVKGGTLLLLPFVDSPKILVGIISSTIFIRYLINKDTTTFENVPPKLAFITGLYSKYGAVDHFPVTPWIIFICIGLIFGKVLTNKKNEKILKNVQVKKETIVSKGLSWCGKKSLEIYIIHWILLYLFFAFVYPKLRNINN